MKFAFFCVISMLALAGCKSEYEQMVDREMAKGIRQDSIFLGMTFGMTRDEFYKHCWDMNSKGLFLNSPLNNSVEYDISKYLRHPGKAHFYPTFFEDKIYEMPVMFMYDGFAWQPSYSSDTMMVDVLKMLTSWYGEFKEFSHPDKGSIYVNVNGNRQIRLYKDKINDVIKSVFTDLSIDKEKVRLALQPSLDTLKH